jgi:IS30 family transposase
MQFYHHFTLEERESLRIYLSEGKSLREAGRLLGKSPSSISRELSRNRNKDGSYHAWRATTLYIIRRKKSVRPFRLTVDTKLRTWVSECLASYWSPEIIAARWKREQSGNKLSHSTIYAALRDGRLPQYTPKTHLRRHGKRKCSHQCYTIHPDHLIRDWPEEIRKRERLGDWEGDTVYGSIGKGLLVTLVDRKSRYFAASVLSKRTIPETKDAVIKALKGLDVNSLSLDNGSEFAGFRDLEKELNAPVYFADPHSPWQRPSNENINGLVRFFFPKGTDFHTVTQDQLNRVISLINNRPRKCLGWLSPIEFLHKCCT